MSTQDIKAKFQREFPQARKIRVRQYPITYKGSMRGYTDISVYGVDISFSEGQQIAKRLLGSLDKTFVSFASW